MVKGRSRNDIERTAKLVRRISSVLTKSESLYFPVVEFVERLAVTTDEESGECVLNLDVVPDRDLPGEYAHYCPKTNTMMVRESVYIGACQGTGRDRFTIAHELGHFFLGHGRTYAFSRVDGDVPAYADPEWQANIFASMVLMPRDRIRGLSPAKVVAQCGVSLQAAEIALTK